MNVPATWRRKQFPGCPNCGEGPGLAQHIGCSNAQAAKADSADLYIDLAEGRNHCIACKKQWAFERTRQHCLECGAVWRGGEIWQGMAAEIGRLENLAWAKVAGLRRGSEKIEFLGWHFCRGCGREYPYKTGYLQTGRRYGGMCESCHDLAKKRLGSWFTIHGAQRGVACGWCRESQNRGRIVHLKKAPVCRVCCDAVSGQRARLAARP